MTRAGFRKMLARLAEKTSLSFPVHPYMLKDVYGYKLASEGPNTIARAQEHSSHHNRYTELTSDRFQAFWKD